MLRSIDEVLVRKGREVHTLPVGASVLDAVALMNRRGIGAVVVLQGGELTGILTERDVMRRVVAERRDPGRVTIGDVMTRSPVTVPPQLRVVDAMRIMAKLRVRHLPVCAEEGALVGIVSVGDLSEWVTRELHDTVTDLTTYICGPAVSPSTEPPPPRPSRVAASPR